MAAYGGLLSLKHLIGPIKLYLSRNQITVDKHLIETLQKKVNFLQEFLETYSNGGMPVGENLESQIIDAVLAAEDEIESHIVDDIHARSKITRESNFKDCFSHVLQKVIDDMDGIQQQAQIIKDKSMLDNKETQSSLSDTSDVPPPSDRFSEGLHDGMEEKSILKKKQPMFDDSLIEEFISKLMVDQANLQFIPITGMGGIGKTTLAGHIFSRSQIKEHFSLFGWITVTQELDLQRALSGLLRNMNFQGNLDDDTPIMELGTMLHKHLHCKRYLIVTDDIWTLKAWDELKLYFPDDKQGSRVMITSRLSDLGDAICPLGSYKMNLLDEKKSWILLENIVFGGGSCPGELQEIGKRIAKRCNGHPLLISVIGGVLSESKEEYWENIEKDIKPLEASEVHEMLRTSYRFLPIHLKPCFLYLGTFPEDHKISVSELEKIWVAEGFLKPIEGTILEDVARIYLKALIDRNLIYVDEDMQDYAGNVQYCKIHDMLRDLSLIEATQHKFLYSTNVNRSNNSQGFSNQRRFALHGNNPKGDKYVDYPHVDNELLSSSFIRSFICTFALKKKPSFIGNLLRIWSVEESYHEEVLSELLNARYLDFGLVRESPKFPASLISLLWNLQTIKSGYRANTVLPCEIWEMSQLRHVNIMMFRLDSPRGGRKDSKDFIELKCLQTLSRVLDFKCSEDVLDKIPYLRHLKVSYGDKTLLPVYLKNLGRLKKLESLTCNFVHDFPEEVLSELEFPEFLKELTLELGDFSWQKMGRKIGSLRHLKKFKLSYCGKCSTQDGEEWNMEDDDDDDDSEAAGANGVAFPKLIYLKIVTKKLKSWTMDSGPLPDLEHLVLEQMKELDGIPTEIGDLVKLRSITLRDCGEEVVDSVELIKERKSISCDDNLVVTTE